MPETATAARVCWACGTALILDAIQGPWCPKCLCAREGSGASDLPALPPRRDGNRRKKGNRARPAPAASVQPGPAFPEPERQRQTPERPTYGARFPGLVDVVEHDGEPAFLMLAAGRLEICHKWEGQQPPPREQLPFLLPSYEAVLDAHREDCDGILFEDLLAYYRGVSQLPTDDHAILLAAYTAHTYLPEHWMYSPILCLYAVPERGKSRTGKGVTFASYRGIHTETLQEANLFRWSNDLGATLFLDVKDLWRKAEKRQSEDILLQRFEKGAKVGRVLWPERGAFRDTRYFDIFGPTVIATNEAVHAILDTRAITVIMPDSDRDFPDPVTPERGLPLRERLVAFRARHLDGPLPSVPRLAAGRLGDIVQPLAVTLRLMAPHREDDLRRLVADLLTERLREKAGTLEARILEATRGLAGQVEAGLLAIGAITAAVNDGRPEKWQKSAESVGRRLTALGFTRARLGSKGSRAIEYDAERLERLAGRYGLAPLEKPSVPSEPLVADTKGLAASGELSAEPSEPSENCQPAGRYETDGSGSSDGCVTPSCAPEGEERKEEAAAWKL